MSRADNLTSREAVLEAIAEYDKLGREAFLQKYGFDRSRYFILAYEGKEYDSKPLVGAGYAFQFPDAEPLRAGDFNGGAETRRVLEGLGFAITMVDGDDADLLDSGMTAESDVANGGGKVPQVDQLARPVLEFVAANGQVELPAAVAAASDATGLGEATRRMRLPNGRTVIDNRVRWTATILSKAGLIDRPGPMQLAITGEGRRLLESHTGDFDREFLIRSCPPFANWIADMGELPAEEESTGKAAVWMVRAGRQGALAGTFIERSLVIVGWGRVGDVSAMTRDHLVQSISEGFPDLGRNQRGQAVNTLWRLAHTMQDGDLVITPEPATRTVLLGRIAGPYVYLNEPVGEEQQHARTVRWFARAQRDELSYGARNSLGTLLTLTRPSHEGELLRLAEAHDGDAPPTPLQQRPGRLPAREPQPVRVEIPPNASVPPRGSIAEFQPISRRMVQLLDELHNGQLALPDFQRSFVWAPDATRELLVSIIRSFPAGALLFLQGGSERFQARTVENAPPLAVVPSHLVLDGQQRLTSLYQAIYGVGPSRFFLDLGALISGSEVDEAVKWFNADRARAFESAQAQADALLMPLSAVRDGGASRWRDEVVDLRNDDDPAAVRSLLREAERTHIDPLVQYGFPVTVLPATTELEAVCTIFETLNRTGKPLTPFELISARAFAGGLSLRDYWEAATSQHPILDDFRVEPYYLLQVIALRLGNSCKRSVVLELPSDDIARHWDEVTQDMAAALTLLRDECGVLVEKWLPYRPMLIPLASAWREVAKAIGPEEGARRGKLKRWFWCSSFTGDYESSSASLAERDAPLLKTWLFGGPEPAVVAEFDWKRERWRSVTTRQQGLYKATMALTLTEHPRDFYTAAPLTREVIEARNIDDHHVFPRGYLRELERGTEVDTVLNHCLIDRATNASIGKKAPSTYLAEIREAIGDQLDHVLQSQRLPTGAGSPLARDDYDAFLVVRTETLDEALTLRAGTGGPSSDIDPHRARLDARIEAIELELRDLIRATIDEDEQAFPPHVIQKAMERVRAAARKHPGDTGLQKPDTLRLLEYLDLRELQDTIASKSLWSAFEDIFATKEQLNNRTMQLAELRNALRHSRTLNEIVIKDGEAAILWFTSALKSRPAPRQRGEPPR